MAHRNIQRLLYPQMRINSRTNGVMHLRMQTYYDESNEEASPFEWYEKAFPKLTKLSLSLRNVDLVDGRVVNMDDNSSVFDDNIEHKLHTFKSLARGFLGSALVQGSVKKNVTASAWECSCFSKPCESGPMTIDSLTKVCNFLNISAQQRNLVRLAICPQVTQHRIWTGALIEILNGLKSDMGSFNFPRSVKGPHMGQQIVSTCLKFLDDAVISHDQESTTWMRPAPAKLPDSPAPNKWEDVLEMFNDLSKSLRNEKKLLFHVSKLEAMKEGLFQMKDVVIDRNIGYREVRHQESLVQKKLSKTLGHPSRCLFTLLQYYLCNSIRDIEVEVCGGLHENGWDDKCRLCIGRILTSDEEKVVRVGVKQLDRALSLFKFVWEIAGKKGVLELQGHLWCVGAESRVFAYRGNVFFIHGISI